MALEITADSNIYISALVFGGRPLQFLNAARAGIFSLAISDPLLDEIRRVLNVKFRWPADMTGDADLLRLERYRNVRIVKVADFMSLIEV